MVTSNRQLAFGLMSATPEISWEQMIAGLRAGDSAIWSHFWTTYGSILESIAERQLSARVQQRVGAEDVVQSACRTFFRRLSAGQFELGDAEDLWRLMCAITLTKARRAARFQTRQKRGVDREQSISAGSSADSSDFQVSDHHASPMELALVADELDGLLNRLSPEECQVLDLKLQQMTNDEIALQMGCSERTVRRLVKSIQASWNRMLDE